LIIVGAALLCMGGLWAQGLKIRMLTEHLEFLPNESLMVGVSIENFSGTPVILGQHREWIRFLIQDVKGRPVVKDKDPPPGEIFIVNSATTTIRWIDLAPYFNVRKLGAYSITAQINVRQWKQDIQADPCRIQVVGGQVLASRKFGVPDPLRRNAPPEIRAFKLLRKRANGRLVLYLRVAEENDYAVYSVDRLGPMVQLSPPEYQLDSEGNIHVFFRSGARTYLYCVANVDGALQKRQTHETHLKKRPAMRMDNKGVIKIKGGRRLFARTDFPSIPEPPRRRLPSLRD
jgi:hypothetical protein